MIRTDIHKPSAIIPTDYEFVGFAHMKVETLGDCFMVSFHRDAIRDHMKSTGGEYAQHEHGGNCHICGASCIYTVIFYHLPSNTYIRTGNDCAEKLEMASNRGDFEAFKTACKEAAELKAGKRKAEAFLGEQNLSAAWALYVAEYSETFQYEENTIRDIVTKLVKYGSISEGQEGFLHKLLAKIADRPIAAAEDALALPCPTGKVVITGEVLCTKWQDSDYGYGAGSLKMLVKDDRGFKVWGTCPSSIEIDKGYRVTFTATVEPKVGDPLFGFYKRPTKAAVLVTA